MLRFVFIRTILLASLMLMSSMGFCAVDCSKYSDAAPPSKGVGMLVGGIIVTSVAVPVGLTSGYIIGHAQAQCDISRDNDEDGGRTCKQEQRGWNAGLLVGGVIIAGGLTGGIMLINKAVAKRREYRAWKGECHGPVAERGLNFEGLKVSSGHNGSALLGVDFSF